MSMSIAARLAPLAARTTGRVSGRSIPRLQACQRMAGSRRSFSGSTSWLVKKYTEDHEWIEMSGDGKIAIGTIGITDYAADQLGDVVYVELPEVGTEVKKGDSMGAVESVKSASDIMTPVTGTITEKNVMLEEKPGQINKNPEGDAWLAKIEVQDQSELDSLMDKDAYAEFTEKSE